MLFRTKVTKKSGLTRRSQTVRPYPCPQCECKYTYLQQCLRRGVRRCHMGTVQRCWEADRSKHRSAKTSQKLQYSSKPREEGKLCGFGGCWGLKHPASNPDTLSPPIRTPSKGERGGKNKTRNPVRAYLVTVWQAVITCMANREI